MKNWRHSTWQDYWYWQKMSYFVSLCESTSPPEDIPPSSSQSLNDSSELMLCLRLFSWLAFPIWNFGFISIYILKMGQYNMNNSIWPTNYFVRWWKCTLKMTDHWLQNLKLLGNSAVGLDKSSSPSLLCAHCLGHLPSLTCSRDLIEYYMKG